jgi:hypothetical protein
MFSPPPSRTPMMKSQNLRKIRKQCFPVAVCESIECQARFDFVGWIRAK